MLCILRGGGPIATCVHRLLKLRYVFSSAVPQPVTRLRHAPDYQNGGMPFVGGDRVVCVPELDRRVRSAHERVNRVRGVCVPGAAAKKKCRTHHRVPCPTCDVLIDCRVVLARQTLHWDSFLKSSGIFEASSVPVGALARKTETENKAILGVELSCCLQFVEAQLAGEQ